MKPRLKTTTMNNVSTLVFSEGRSLDRVFKISGLLVPRFGTTPQSAMRFTSTEEAQAVLDTLPKNIRETCSLQSFIF
jgi:hypothetical protein